MLHLILGGAAVYLSSLMTSFTPRYQDILYSWVRVQRSAVERRWARISISLSSELQ